MMDKKLKKLKSALYRADHFYIGYIQDGTLEERHNKFISELERRSNITSVTDNNKFLRRYFLKQAKDYSLILSLVKELGLNYYEVDNMWSKIKHEKTALHEEMKKMPRETRDNKGVIIRNTRLRTPNHPWRYPSKKRSLRTWKIFYEMFPHLTEFDKWDGKQSKRRPLK